MVRRELRRLDRTSADGKTRRGLPDAEHVMSEGPVSEFLAAATDREAVDPSDGKGGSSFERVTVRGQRYFVKRLSPATDWIMRVSGDTVHRPFLIWRAGLMDQMPACIDHTIVAMEVEGSGDTAVLSLLMHDVSEFLIPEGDAVVDPVTHAEFIDHLAQLCAAFWGFADTIGGLTTVSERLRLFSASNVARELAVADPPGTIVAADAGWRALPDRSPALAGLAHAVHDDPTLLTDPLAEAGITFLHGDWKMGNLGRHPDGRTILLDFFPGAGPACWDLCWYLALNRARIPESKEATIIRFRSDLERHGVDTAGWFERQLDLCLAAMMVVFGWEKALGPEDELHWWETAVSGALGRQGLDVVEPGR